MNSTASARAAASESPSQRLARGFAAQLAIWARQLGMDAQTQRITAHAAEAVSLATSDGHVCISLHDLDCDGLPGLDGLALRARLLASGLVGTPEQPGAMPLILDGEDRLYLHRYFDFERRLAHRLARAAAAGLDAPDAIGVESRLHLSEWFQASADRLGAQADWQKIAAALALRNRLTIISGGPGTGKTTTVVNLLACLIAEQPDCRIVLAAPTGKAATRMTEAIRQRAAHLPESLRARLPAESFTVHRLLGVTPATGGFTHHAGNPLAIDVLVVDEASMLDLALATRLLEAVPPAARIILLGDKDQLAAVESGAVFAELSADPGLTEGCREALAEACGLSPAQLVPPMPVRESALRDSVIWFTQNFRFAADSGIGHLAADINAARVGAAAATLKAGTDAAIRWLDEADGHLGEPVVQVLFNGYSSYLEAVQRDPRDAARLTEVFGAFRALCAVREGPRGMSVLNELMVQRAREVLAPLESALRSDRRSAWFPGRPVMVLRNDPVLKLFNGDVGITVPGPDDRLTVAFPDPAGGFRCVAPVRLPEHQTAFAMTVHKAQGSEFDEVLVLLPHQRSPVLTRELLYTAVTRARRRVTLACSAAILAATVQTVTRRHSGLLARLREAVEAVGAGHHE